MFAEDETLRQTIDRFIQDNIKAVTESKKFFGLPQIPVEITGTLFCIITSSARCQIMIYTGTHWWDEVDWSIDKK